MSAAESSNPKPNPKQVSAAEARRTWLRANTQVDGAVRHLAPEGAQTGAQHRARLEQCALTYGMHLQFWHPWSVLPPPLVRCEPLSQAAMAEPPAKRPKPTFSASPDLEAIRSQQAAFAEARDWDQFHTPRNLALALVGEVGELCEIFQWKGDHEVQPGLPGWTDAKRQHLGEEMADVLNYLVRLADKCGIDLPAVADAKIQKNAAKYPASLVKGSAKKYNEYGAAEVAQAASQAAAEEAASDAAWGSTGSGARGSAVRLVTRDD